MKLPDKYGYGNLFGYSGLDGENSHDEDFIGMTMSEPLTIRFDDPRGTVTLHLDAEEDTFAYILSDAIRTDWTCLAFADQHTIIGKSKAVPELYGSGGCCNRPNENVSILRNGPFWYVLCRDGASFVLCKHTAQEEAIRLAKRGLDMDIEELMERKLDYYRNLPSCPEPAYEKLYYKALSVNKVNVYSPQNGFACRSTTPDRLPHRHVWLWDSMFHAIAIARYNPSLAKESILAVLQCQREDGFIPHMMKSKDEVSSITQPQVIAWAALEVYRSTGDLGFLWKTASRISAYLRWFLHNRDENQNALPEWKTDFYNTHCRCDESGMDNSPRFDTTEKLDAIDSASFMGHDCRCMAEICDIIGDSSAEAFFTATANRIAEQVNRLLWSEEKGVYCDRTFSGRLTGVMTCASFLPLFAGICTSERAGRLVGLLTDPGKFWSVMPVPSVSQDDPAYGTDMWRGAVWLNYNYMILQGLKRYGYTEQAEKLRRRTLLEVERVFEETGMIFEFYDPDGKRIPWSMRRKGEQPLFPDYRVKIHSITDYNWSASFILLMLLED